MAYSGVVFNPGDYIDGEDKFGRLIDNDQYLKTIADQLPRGLLGSAVISGNVTSNAAETTLATINLWIPDTRTIKVTFEVLGMTYSSAAGTNNLKLRIYEDATQKNECWGKIQNSSGIGNSVNEPLMYGAVILPDITAGNHTIYLKGILNTAAPTGFNGVAGTMYVYDIGKQVATS